MNDLDMYSSVKASIFRLTQIPNYHFGHPKWGFQSQIAVFPQEDFYYFHLQFDFSA